MVDDGTDAPGLMVVLVVAPLLVESVKFLVC